METVIPAEQASRSLTSGEVMQIVRLKRTWLCELVKRGQFPTPIRVGVNKRVWLEHEIRAWMETRRRA
jgi:prophage regulatory protein